MDYLGPVLNILLPIGIGIALRQFGVFGTEDSARIRRFCITFAVPLLVFSSMYTAERVVFGQLGPMVICMLLMTGGFFLVGYVGSLVVQDIPERTAIHASIAFGNYGWIGWAVANVVLGAAGFQRAVFFTAMWWPTFYSFGLAIGLIHHEPEESGGVLHVMLNRLAPVAIAIVLGIGINFLGITIPAPIYGTIKSFADMTVPLILLTVGLDLRFASLFGFLPKALLVSILRVLAGPAIGIGVALVGRAVFDLDVTSLHVIILNGAMPVATTTPVLGDHYPMKTEIAGASIVLSTLLSLVTLPLWISLVDRIPLG